MTREEIKRLADESETAMANLCCNEIMRLDKVLKAKWQEARVALHAAIDAIPSIRQTMVTCIRCGLLVPESDLMGNLTDAALEGAPSGDYSANGEPLYHPPESKGESQ